MYQSHPGKNPSSNRCFKFCRHTTRRTTHGSALETFLVALLVFDFALLLFLIISSDKQHNITQPFISHFSSQQSPITICKELSSFYRNENKHKKNKASLKMSIIFIVKTTKFFTSLLFHHLCQKHSAFSPDRYLLEPFFRSHRMHRCHHLCRHSQRIDLLGHIHSRKSRSG